MKTRRAVMLMAMLPFSGCTSDERETGETIERKGQPSVTYVADDSPEMSAAIEKARSTVDQFTTALSKPKAAQSSFSVKLAVKDGDFIEHMWITPVRHENGQFVGTINNEPDRIASHKMGDNVSVPTDRISDWMYVDNGRLVGGFTLRLLRSRMPEEQAYEFDRSVPFVITDDHDPDEPLVQFFDSLGNAEHDVLSSLLAAHPEFANRVGNVAVVSALGDMELRQQHPLAYAVYHDNTKAVEILLRHKADPNARDEYRGTPLHKAARFGHPNLIQILADFGADVNARNRIGLTPLMTAAGNVNLECVRVLLELGADVRLRLTETNQNVLHNIESVEIASVLLRAGAELDGKDTEGDTPLHHAVFNEFVDVAVFFIQERADLDVKNNEGKTPVDIARTVLESEGLTRVLDAVNKRRNAENQ